MTAIVENILDTYKYIFEDLANPNTKGLFLAGKPIHFACLLIFYLYFTKRLGPWYMKDRQPYNLKNVIKFFNLIQVIVNLHITCQGLMYTFSEEFSWRCQNLDDPKTPRAKWIAYMTWCYFITKIVDLLDTVFFVLRKSDRQITSLHLHHHTLMPVVSWIAVTYFPGGQASILGSMNCFVHAVMYTYYYIAGLGDKYKKYLWWKRHVTELQMAQFIFVGSHAFITLFYECGYPAWIKMGVVIYACIFINLFGKFYYSTYIVKSSKKKYDNAKYKAVNGNHKNGNATNEEMNGGERDFKTINNKYRNGKNMNRRSSKEIKNHKTTL